MKLNEKCIFVEAELGLVSHVLHLNSKNITLDTFFWKIDTFTVEEFLKIAKELCAILPVYCVNRLH